MKKFDFKKENKHYYLPKNNPEIITIPKMNFITIRGKGNPNEVDGEYDHALKQLYAIAYTIKMKGKELPGYFEYVVPPLEGFWWMDGIKGIDYQHKELFQWIAVIRLPDFVTKEACLGQLTMLLPIKNKIIQTSSSLLMMKDFAYK